MSGPVSHSSTCFHSEKSCFMAYTSCWPCLRHGCSQARPLTFSTAISLLGALPPNPHHPHAQSHYSISLLTLSHHSISLLTQFYHPIHLLTSSYHPICLLTPSFIASVSSHNLVILSVFLHSFI